MNTTELRQSFKHIHAYQDWQRQCEALADMLDARGKENVAVSAHCADLIQAMRDHGISDDKIKDIANEQIAK